MENSSVPLTAEDFQKAGKSLNFDGFTNLEKATSHVDFIHEYIREGKFEVFSAANVANFLKGVGEEINKIEKAEDGELTVKDVLTKAKEEIESLTKIEVFDQEGSKQLYFVREKVEKADDGEGEDNLDKSKETDLEKGDISYKLGGNGDKMFKKTGKEIKEKLIALKTKIETKAAGYRVEMETSETKLGVSPTEKLNEWQTEGQEEKLSGLRDYHWNMTYYNKGGKGDASGEASIYSETARKVIVSASSEEDAKYAREHNRAVSKLVGCIKDQSKVEVYERNLEEGKSYDMTLDQIEALGF